MDRRQVPRQALGRMSPPVALMLILVASARARLAPGAARLPIHTENGIMSHGSFLIYVLHCFQKKSTSGVRTARQDVSLIHQRLRTAQTDYEVRYGRKEN